MAKQPAVPDITICILNWNAKGYLARCLDSLFHPEEPDVQEALERAGLAGEQEPAEAVSIDVLVVDNGSIDYSADMVERRFPEASALLAALALLPSGTELAPPSSVSPRTPPLRLSDSEQQLVSVLLAAPRATA